MQLRCSNNHLISTAVPAVYNNAAVAQLVARGTLPTDVQSMLHGRVYSI
jgi:hypothetical protein